MELRLNTRSSPLLPEFLKFKLLIQNDCSTKKCRTHAIAALPPANTPKPPPFKPRHAQRRQHKRHRRHSRIHERIRQLRNKEKHDNNRVCKNQNGQPASPTRLPRLIRLNPHIASLDLINRPLKFIKGNHKECD